MRTAVVFGGYGTFGSHVARDLARLGVPLVIAGRDLARAGAFAAPLHARAAAADIRDVASCRRVLDATTVAVSCAGPFATLGTALLEACLDAGSHYADICDERAFARTVFAAYGPRFRERGLVAATGCSSLPGISGALALVARKDRPVRSARITLFIGNDNPKGAAAVRSAVGVLGRPIEAPQGTLRGFRGRETVSLPAPFGRRSVYEFESPEYDLFPALLGAREVRVKVGFELRTATFAFATLAALGSSWGARTARFLEKVSSLAPRSGCSGGAVQVDLAFEDGSAASAALSGAADGQRMAALPCALAARALAAASPAPGATTAYELLGARALLDAIAAEGFQLSA